MEIRDCVESSLLVLWAVVLAILCIALIMFAANLFGW